MGTVAGAESRGQGQNVASMVASVGPYWLTSSVAGSTSRQRAASSGASTSPPE
jgi:hypothetical protein